MHKKLLCIFLFIPLFFIVKAQDIFKLTGTTIHNDLPVADVHIINKSFNKYTITDADGRFDLMARVGDTLVFSAVQFKLKTVILASKDQLDVILVERINELDEVVLYNKLSGDPVLDIKNSGVEKQLNFYDLGIPGSQKAPPTQSERRLQEATFGKFRLEMLSAIPLTPILNAISGRTKMLKKRVKQESAEAFLEQIKEQFEPILIDVYGLKKEESYRFFYYCTLDESYHVKCQNANSVVRMEFLINQLEAFQKIEKE